MEESLLKQWSPEDDTHATASKSSSTLRGKVAHVLESRAMTIAIISLIVLDTIFVLGELILELEMVVEKEHIDEHHYELIEESLRTASISILSFFMGEIVLAIVVHGIQFFKSWGHVLDAVVVSASWVFECFVPAGDVVGLLIVFRLWRVVRIIHGAVESTKKKAERKIAELEHTIAVLQEELKRIREAQLAVPLA